MQAVRERLLGAWAAITHAHRSDLLGRLRNSHLLRWPRTASASALTSQPGSADANVRLQVSYGPTIKGAHSPDEAVQISTVQPFWDLTLSILGELADQR